MLKKDRILVADEPGADEHQEEIEFSIPYQDNILAHPRVLNYEEQAHQHYGSKYIQHPAVPVLKSMIEEYDRKGRNSNKGFFEYGEGGSRQLWS